MAIPRLTPDQIAQVCGLVAQYIATQRETYSPRAVPLSAQQKNALAGFFLRLDGTRLLVLQGERVATPDFYPMLRSLGFKSLRDQSTMAAITFCDVVVSHEPFSDGLLFHELVHLEQYRQLGIPRFAELYVSGFLNGGSYEAIPLEFNAYTLGGRFESDPRRMFSVEDEVGRWAAEGDALMGDVPKGRPLAIDATAPGEYCLAAWTKGEVARFLRLRQRNAEGLRDLIEVEDLDSIFR